MSQLTVVRFVIPINTALSNEQDLRHLDVVAFQMPAAWTAATLSFKSRPVLTNNNGSDDSLQSVYDGAAVPAEVTIGVAAARYVLVPADLGYFRGLGATQLVSGTNAATVNQTAAREILAVCRPST